MNRLNQEVVNRIGLIHEDEVGVLVAQDAVRKPVDRTVLAI